MVSSPGNDIPGSLSNESPSFSGATFCDKCHAHFELFVAHNVACHPSEEEADKLITHCMMCGLVFTSHSDLLDHLVDHRSCNVFICVVCGMSYGDSVHLLEHLEVHKELHIYYCDLCTATFATKLCFLGHREASHVKQEEETIGREWKSDGDESSDSCFEERVVWSSQKPRLRRSQVKKIKIEVKKEPIEKIVHWKQVRASVKLDDSKWKCIDCDRTFSSQKGSRYHYRQAHGTLQFKCDLCHQMFPVKNKLEAHVAQVHGTKSTLICDQCGAAFGAEWNLQNHKRTVHETPYTCFYCEATFHYKKTLSNHLTIKVCSPCDQKQFPCRGTFVQHCKETHTSEKLFPCNFCSAKFPVEAFLKWHKSVKHKKLLLKEMRGLPFSCSLCSFQTNSKHNLARHKRRSHLGPPRKRKRRN